MKKIIVLFLISFISILNANTYVRGYYKSNGKYVKPHYRSSSNRTEKDNWSTKGNINPYTGKKGYKKAKY